jgi:hypothetical protein
MVIIGYVVYAHSNNGKIFVKVNNGYELDELHNVNITGATAGQVLEFDGTLWVNSPNKLNSSNPSYTGLMTGTGSTQTGTSSTGVLNLSQTWNTTGSPTAIRLNVTNTTSGVSANLMDLQVGGTTQFRIARNGAVLSGQITTPGITLGNVGNATGITLGGGAGTIIYAAQTPTTAAANHTFSGAGIFISSGHCRTVAISTNFSNSAGTATFTSLFLNETINQTGTANGITRGLWINPTLTSAVDYRAIEVAAGKLVYSSTITATGTTGAQTINRISGKVNAAAGSTSLVVTNSLSTTSSIVMCELGTNDATCVIKSVVEANGSFTINYVAPTAETVIKFIIIN